MLGKLGNDIQVSYPNQFRWSLMLKFDFRRIGRILHKIHQEQFIPSFSEEVEADDQENDFYGKEVP